MSVPSKSNAAILLLAVSLTDGFAINTDSSAFIHLSEDFLGLMSKKGCSVADGLSARTLAFNAMISMYLFSVLCCRSV